MTLEQSSRELRILFNTLNGVLSDVAWVRELDTQEKRDDYIRKYFADTQQKLSDASRVLKGIVEAAGTVDA